VLSKIQSTANKIRYNRNVDLPVFMNNPDSKYISEPLKKLLVATLSNDAEAVKFYTSWRDSIDFENISFAEYELLSKVYASLQRAKFTDKLTLKIKGICRRTWLENELYKNEVTNFFEILDNAGGGFILLTREPLTFSLNTGETNFSVRNFQILSHDSMPLETLKNLEKSGWKVTEKSRGKFLNEQESWFNHGTRLNLCVKFDSHIFAKDVWKFAETIKFGGKNLKVLSSADYLLQILETEFLSTEKRNDGIWILLTTLTLQNNSQIDWERLARKSQKLWLNYALVEMLDETVKFAPSEKFSKARYKFFDSPPNKLQRLFLAYQSLKKSYKKTGEDFSIFGFANFLQRHWKVDSLFELPWQIGKRFLKF
jgi:hypothetical protein